MKRQRHTLTKWLTPGLRLKRWLALLIVGITLISLGLAQAILTVARAHDIPPLLELLTLRFLAPWARVAVTLAAGGAAIGFATYQLNRSIMAPFALRRHESLIDAMVAHSRRQRGLKVVAIGGGTGLPSVLRGLKHYTGNITAIVTAADDGGSSGRLRREMGVLPPGDLRSNIAALANDEALMTHLFQYRFAYGGLGGHNFGNLFLTAMADITGSMDRALAETAQVLAIEGRVLPSTLQDDVVLMAEVRMPGETRLRRVSGESQIPESGGKIERVFLHPDQVRAYPEALRAILDADLIVIGPGSLYTSILPNLLVPGIVEAIRASGAYRVYICNVATQVGETDGYSVADHVRVLEAHVGSDAFRAVLANNHYPTKNAGENTHYVQPDVASIAERYDVLWADLTDAEQPWRHDPQKLTQALLGAYERATTIVTGQQTSLAAG
ncbi:MAG: YvcK family protein [Chloroflexi bacterium]|nr:YvcK family protein [Chloroflexota bacterium]